MPWLWWVAPDSCSARGDTYAVKSAIKPRPGISGALFDTVERWTHLGLGMSTLMQQYSNSTYETVATEVPAPTNSKSKRVRKPAKPRYTRGVAEPQFDGMIALAPGAILNIALKTQSRSFDAIANAERRLQAPAEFVSRTPLVAALLGRIRAVLAEQNAEYQLRQQDRVDLAADYLARYAPTAMDELLARVDVDSFFGRVNMDDVMNKVDLEAMVDRVPVDQVIDKIDLRAIVLDTVGQVQMTDILKESTSSTARALRDGVSSATKRPFRKSDAN